MSGSPLSPRIQRKQTPPRIYYAHRKYLKHLLVDFEKRCAYSDQHLDRAGGQTGMHIDHHNPTLKSPARNAYKNLFLTTAHCNCKKGKNWPPRNQRAKGIRFLNPCEEQDYGVHIFEDPSTFEWWGATPAGKYHIRILDLNAEHLVRERRHRHQLLELRRHPQAVVAIRTDALEGIQTFRKEVDAMIRPIPQKPKPPPPA